MNDNLPGGMYARLGVRPVVNAAATLTAVGGSLMSPEVLEAMAQAASTHVDMYELHAAAGRRIAELSRNDAAYVTSGCAAAIVLAVLGCITQGDPRKITLMPDGAGLPTEVVMHCSHRIPYDPAIALAGAKVVQVGNAVQTFEWELEAALTERTAAVLYVAGVASRHSGPRPSDDGADRACARRPGHRRRRGPAAATHQPLGAHQEARCRPCAL